MKTKDLLTQYQQLSTLTEQMLMMVRENDWDNLLSLQAEYEQTSLALQASSKLDNPASELNTQERDIISSQIANILSNQKELQQLMSAHRAKIAELIGETVSQHSQIKSYHQMATLV